MYPIYNLLFVQMNYYWKKLRETATAKKINEQIYNNSPF